VSLAQDIRFILETPGLFINDFHLVCPQCRSELSVGGNDEYHCTQDGEKYSCVGGIWRFLSAERQAFYSVFMEEYQRVRQGEGRVRRDPQYYRNLPFSDSLDKMASDWRIRAASFKAFVRDVLAPLEYEHREPIKCLDLGAGNSWLSNQLAHRGHLVAAVDLITNDWDGLGVYVNYTTSFLRVQTEFDQLPFSDHQCDLAIFNSSLHYSVDCQATLTEALRVVKPRGKIIVIDTPVYYSPLSGQKMVEEREELFFQDYGLRSNTLPSENFLTHSRINELSEILGIKWTFIKPFYGIQWALKPWVHRLSGRREPAAFYVLIGEQVRSG